MSTELIPILALVVMFIAATVWPVNMGALGFVAAFFVGTLAVGMSTDDIIGGFPSELFLTLVGVTYLFAIAQNNGTVDLMVRGAVRLVRGRVALIPWVMFGITGVLTAVGALGPAAVAIIAPIALGFAARYKINPLLMGMMVIHGAQAGGFSPSASTESPSTPSRPTRVSSTAHSPCSSAVCCSTPRSGSCSSFSSEAGRLSANTSTTTSPRWPTRMGPVRRFPGRAGLAARPATRRWRRRVGARPRPSPKCRPQQSSKRNPTRRP